MTAVAAPLPVTAAHKQVHRWQNGVTRVVRDRLAEEVPVALVYSGIPYVVMLATPQDLEDFAIGFSISEQIIARPDEIRSLDVQHLAQGIRIEVCIPRERFLALADRQRNLAGRTGRGLCGTQDFEQAIRNPVTPLRGGIGVSPHEIHAQRSRLHTLQRINAVTGAVHAAAWVVPGNGIVTVREDIGRHNALDKLIGALAQTGADVGQGYVLITSRASYEMVQKAAVAGIAVVVAVSAPTALAVQIAEESGVTLLGFARDRHHVVYTHPERIAESTESCLCTSNA